MVLLVVVGDNTSVFSAFATQNVTCLECSKMIEPGFHNRGTVEDGDDDDDNMLVDAVDCHEFLFVHSFPLPSPRVTFNRLA